MTDDRTHELETAYAQAVAALAADVAVNALTVDWLRTRLAMEQRVLDERLAVAAALEATITGKREDEHDGATT